ncbi:helix-turn-helix domain-containing protein [Pseudonocardia broussonetiae]|uniref:Helix-turn-helix transcriptional regulator n=1 Tax=Pseudonocardia broussonetiae TaxID=2736640 RepID=A0A6M6JG12_9PSEU|nr:helix-turn-helix transcriptional regulator [Pseudonocardia broussonetiae]QJY46904.1 helix-turn-helix transcriptional regulator [Pseudonocardia broussonetiae]
MSTPTGADGVPTSALREARAARGWSQSGAAGALRALAERRGGPDASAASLKTQLSRWENGHARPEPEYRALLAELYGRSAEELGLAVGPPGPPDGRERLRGALAAAAAVDDGVVRQWAAQLESARRVDDELGAAGSAGVTAALVAQLVSTLRHTAAPARRPALAAVLSGAAALAGRHALDDDDPDAAWGHLDTAAAAAREAGSPVLVVAALVGRAEVLREIGDARGAAALLADPALPTDPNIPTGPAVPTEPAFPDDAARAPEQEPLPAADRARLDAARAVALAAAGKAEAARRALAAPPIDAAHPQGVGIEWADVHHRHGQALLELGDPAAAARLESGLAAGPRSARTRAGLHADLARALAGSDPGSAAGHAREARALALRIGARRLTARLGSTS